jgi:hypothetical protein
LPFQPTPHGLTLDNPLCAMIDLPYDSLTEG